MRRSFLTPLSFAALAAVLLPACGNMLPPATIVTTPRVLAIVSDQPESHPGDDITLRVMAFDPMGRTLSYRWRSCLSIPSLLASSNIPTSLPDVPCTPLASTTEVATVPGADTQAVVDQMRMLGELGGFDTSFLFGVLNTAGFSFRVQVDVVDETGAVLVSAFKRVAITGRETLTTNPPSIDYLVGDTFVSMPVEGFTGTGFDCVIWGDPVTVEADADLVFSPQGDEARWIETFPIFDYAGGVQSGTENAYYSFNATAGALSAETTRPPERDVTYTAPEEPGTVRMFLVVRDGHLGTRACTFELTVVPATTP